MLTNLHVKNLALIDEAFVEFGKGLNILTGETGAGKSILLGSVNLALGAKFEKDMLRKGEEQALVELSFAGEQSEKLKEILQEEEIPDSDGEILISRRMTVGKSVFRVNGEVVSARIVKAIAEELLDIHGQHEHQSLLKKAKHLEILDAYAGEDAQQLLKEVGGLYRERNRIREELDAFTMDEETRKREADLLSFEITELEEADLKPGEDESLEADFRRMNHAQKISGGVLETLGILEEDSGISDLIGNAIRSLKGLEEYDASIGEFQTQLYDLESLVSDLAKEMSAYAAAAEFDESEFAVVRDRLNEINRLKGKYGNDFEEMMKALQKKQERLDLLIHFDREKELKEKELADITDKLRNKAGLLSEIRKKAAGNLEKVLIESLQDLNFLSVEFQIRIEPLEEINTKGADDVEFMISTNPGESLRELSMVASGGELSRIMLAIKTILATKDDIDTLIFDEIDTGISGKTAWKVAGALQKVARAHQVICITHLSQIAAMGDHHFVIEKSVVNGTTQTGIRDLSDQESLAELGRLLGMDETGDTAIENAKEMKERAAKIKNANA